MDLQLTNKVALVTGSSKGIGEAIARALAREGAYVLVHGREEAQVRRVVDDITSTGARAHAVLGDLTQEDAVEQMLTDVRARIAPIDILVNNAGGSGPKDTWATTKPGDWASTYDRNVLATLRVSTRVLPGMRQAGWGRVINISSAAAIMPPATGPDYAAAKAAMNAMVASMAKAVASDGVTVNTISPGAIRSARLETAFRAAAAERGLAPTDAPWEEIQRQVLPLFANVPLGRVGELEELANAVAFLASPLAGFITGANLHVDGGFLSLP